MRIINNFSSIGAAIRKDLRLYEARLSRATKGAATRAANGLKQDLRAQVTSAGLGQKVANAWRSASYPKEGDSLNAAGVVWSKAPHIISSFDRGTVIRARKGTWLAIPTDDAPKQGLGGKKITPANWPDHRFGPLRFVRGKNGKAFLVADNLRASYSKKTKQFRGFKAASAKAKQKGRGLTSVVMFILVPQANLKKRLDVEKAARKWAAEFPRLIERNMRGNNS